MAAPAERENQLEALSKITVVVADTGDIESIAKFKPTDATTNPSLLLKAASLDKYQHLLADAIAYATKNAKNEEHKVSLCWDKLAVNFGVEILKIVKGVVSTEVNARLSFDTEGTIAKAREIIALYEEAGIKKERVLVKIASTWEGIKAAEILQKEGISCNMTLLFNFAQAVACAEAGVTLISPFVGRILDWYKKATGKEYAAVEDPGVVSVTRIYNYYKKFGYPTIVMGASFRSREEVTALAGCDKLTISPELLDALQKCYDPLPRALSAEAAQKADLVKTSYHEKKFRWEMNEDAMATEKLAEGIRNFASDGGKLEKLLLAKMQAKA